MEQTQLTFYKSRSETSPAECSGHRESGTRGPLSTQHWWGLGGSLEEKGNSNPRGLIFLLQHHDDVSANCTCLESFPWRTHRAPGQFMVTLEMEKLEPLENLHHPETESLRNTPTHTPPTTPTPSQVSDNSKSRRFSSLLRKIWKERNICAQLEPSIQMTRQSQRT